MRNLHYKAVLVQNESAVVVTDAQKVFDTAQTDLFDVIKWMVDMRSSL